MSVYSAKTGLSSILKNYNPSERERVKTNVINKVRFELPKQKGVIDIIDSVNSGNFEPYTQFIQFLKETSISDDDLFRVISEARKSVHALKPTFSVLVETLLSLEWISRRNDIVDEYLEFYVELLIAHCKYAPFAINKLIANWIPKDDEKDKWPDACPSKNKKKELEYVHKLLAKLLNVIPMIYSIVLESIESSFPYYKKPSWVIGGYIHNIFWILCYKPAFTTSMVELLFKNLLILDVNAPRNEIEDAEYGEEEEDNDTMFTMEECHEEDDEKKMKHPIAETLDVCMEEMFSFIEKYIPQNNLQPTSNYMDANYLFKIFEMGFENILLPSHNTHHVQFLMFYFCSFKSIIAEKFLRDLWQKVINPNMSAPIRQASVGYIASLLARGKFLSLNTLRFYLSEMCSWAHQYIQGSDSVRINHSLRANIVFFSVCQAIFYVIAFRSRDLTADKKGLLFLQSLQLSALVTSHFNPLRVCLPAVATAFAGVTRAYQLAYCHTILERNARRKLATVYANDTSTPEECLDTFFPFDPYLLKKSGKRITPIYLQYQANEIEEDSNHMEINLRRKRHESEMDDIDDFIVDKRQKRNELSKSHDKEMQFNYGLSPGFQV